MTSGTLDRINIGLMGLALAAALLLPFELFLFAYAVLGPLHSLTEIGWLSERRFFTRGRGDAWFLIGLLGLMVLGQGQIVGSFAFAPLSSHGYRFVLLGFVLAGLFALVEPGRKRWALFVAAVAASFALGDGHSRGLFLFALYVTTIVHVGAFTGAFLLQGALRSKNRSGYAAFLVFLGCCVLTVVLPPTALTQVGPYVAKSYEPFAAINGELARLFGFGSGATEGPWIPFNSYKE